MPLAFRDLIDFGFGEEGRRGGRLLGTLSLNGHFIALFGLATIWALAVAARYYTVSWVGERVTADLRNAVYALVLSQSPQFFETLQTGEVLSRLTGDTTLIQTVVGSSISMGLRSVFQFIGGMVMLAVTSFYLFSLNLGPVSYTHLDVYKRQGPDEVEQLSFKTPIDRGMHQHVAQVGDQVGEFEYLGARRLVRGVFDLQRFALFLGQ